MGYRPRIQRGGSIYDLPLPLYSTNERFSRVVRQTEVPLQDGVFATESRRGALQVSFAGMITVGNPQDARRTIGMVSSIQTEHDRLVERMIENGDPMVFYRYVNNVRIPGTEGLNVPGTRFYRDCFCIDLSFDWSNRTTEHLPYSFTLLVPDGVEWRRLT